MPDDVPGWPLMEEEVLILEGKDKIYFNFPYQLYKKELRRRLLRYNVEVNIKEDVLGGKRVEITVDKQVGLEIKAWLSIRLPTMREKYYVTELEEVSHAKEEA
ncbi:hypothetical protein [Thermofilum pendens]|uniref:Uncharacterized protein n=1 Tax=Thermofilum pendens (strain DSM 2475 / Hrk 5) TaxID=368408 RepID=A1RX07_THEPD|nr:hypothetical protein [Thermofilum pendens]ABL77737.1 hypothetical protein Tpen_0328 [Thermofilum pendens Hrk 5]